MSTNYHAYLLRLERTPDHPHWRPTLQNVETGEVLRFATEQGLLRHLLHVLEWTAVAPDNRSAIPTD